MKGFIHILEIIIISMVMFFILFQFSLIPKIDTNWERTKLYLIANDLVHTLDKINVDWDDSVDISNTIGNITTDLNLSQNLLYDVKIKDSGGVNTIIFNQINNPVTVSLYESQPVGDGSTEFREIIFSVGYLF